MNLKTEKIIIYKYINRPFPLTSAGRGGFCMESAVFPGGTSPGIGKRLRGTFQSKGAVVEKELCVFPFFLQLVVFFVCLAVCIVMRYRKKL